MFSCFLHGRSKTQQFLAFWAAECRTHCHSLRVLKCGSKKTVFAGRWKNIAKSDLWAAGCIIAWFPCLPVLGPSGGPHFHLLSVPLTNSALSRRQPREKKKSSAKGQKHVVPRMCKNKRPETHPRIHDAAKEHKSLRLYNYTYPQANGSILNLPALSMGRKPFPYFHFTLHLLCMCNSMPRQHV